MGEESACNAGDTGDVASVPGLGRSPGEGNACTSKDMKKVYAQDYLLKHYL